MIQVSDVGVGDSSKALIAVLDRIVFFVSNWVTNSTDSLRFLTKSISMSVSIIILSGPIFSTIRSVKNVEQVRNA